MGDNELGQTLRSWRDRLAPAAVGLPSRGPRRAPGLRREEVAQLAGVSADYLTRLEQGRATHPSPSVVDSLARALRLGADEREHLFRLAGQTPPGPGRMERHMTPGVQRIVDRLGDVPVMVVDAAWSLVTWNPLAAALIGDPSGRTGRDLNMLWGYFNGEPRRVVHEGRDAADFEHEAVADLHAALARYPEDPELVSLIADLRDISERFDVLWEARPAVVRSASRKTIRHPEVGDITLDCDVLLVHGTDLRLVVYTAVPDTPDAAALELIRVLGLQDLAT